MSDDFIETSICGELGPNKTYHFKQNDWEETATLLSRAHRLLECFVRGGVDFRGIPVFIVRDSMEFIKEYDEKFLKESVENE